MWEPKGTYVPIVCMRARTLAMRSPPSLRIGVAAQSAGGSCERISNLFDPFFNVLVVTPSESTATVSHIPVVISLFRFVTRADQMRLEGRGHVRWALSARRHLTVAVQRGPRATGAAHTTSRPAPSAGTDSEPFFRHHHQGHKLPRDANGSFVNTHILIV